MGSHFVVFGAPPILEPILVGIESDVHGGYDLDFDAWPNGFRMVEGPSPSSLFATSWIDRLPGQFQVM